MFGRRTNQNIELAYGIDVRCCSSGHTDDPEPGIYPVLIKNKYGVINMMSTVLAIACHLTRILAELGTEQNYCVKIQSHKQEDGATTRFLCL
jgi:hypothetical protein